MRKELFPLLEAPLTREKIVLDESEIKEAGLEEDLMVVCTGTNALKEELV